MSRVFITSDLHLGHNNLIVNYRKFNSLYNYNWNLTDNWNKAIHKRDKVFILGDVTMESSKHYHLLSKLNGNKVFILGNHDKMQREEGLLSYGSVAGMVSYKGYWLTHAPIHPQELRGKKNIHGHTHHKNIVKWFGLARDKRYINACLDVNNYTPQLFSELIK